MIIGPRLPAPTIKYGFDCEHDRWINGRHYTFCVHFGWSWHDGEYFRRTTVHVTKWDDADMWVAEERTIQFPEKVYISIAKLYRKEELFLVD